MKMFSCYAVNQALGETVVETSVLSVLCKYAGEARFGASRAVAATNDRAAPSDRLLSSSSFALNSRRSRDSSRDSC